MRGAREVPYVNRVENNVGEVLTVDGKVFLPSYAEVYHTDAEPWIYEGSWITFFTNNADRIKFKTYARPENQQIFTQNTDPCLVEQNNVQEGDMWIDTGSSSIGKLRVGDTWLSATYYWLRGASLTNATGFYIVSNPGGAYTTGTSATNASGVVLRFSI